jgi:hypothetical protein
MKKILILTAALGLCVVSTQAQGLISFANGLTSLVQLNGSNAPAGTKVELFYQPGAPSAPPVIWNGSAANMGSWEATTGANGNPYTLTGSNGRFAGGTQSTGTDVAAGADAWLTVVGWTGGYSNLVSAVTGGGAIAESTIFEIVTGGGGSPPSSAAPITGAPVE